MVGAIWSMELYAASGSLVSAKCIFYIPFRWLVLVLLIKTKQTRSYVEMIILFHSIYLFDEKESIESFLFCGIFLPCPSK